MKQPLFFGYEPLMIVGRRVNVATPEKALVDLMKDEALALARGAADPAARLNLLREYVHAFALRSLHESEAFSSIAFVGGTALRFLENLPRFCKTPSTNGRRRESGPSAPKAGAGTSATDSAVINPGLHGSIRNRCSF